MIIAGAGGFAKELYSEYKRDNSTHTVFFYDNINHYDKPFLLDTTILQSFEAIKEIGEQEFLIGTGNPQVRKKLFELFTLQNLKPAFFVSSKANIGQYEIIINPGVVIMAGCVLTTCIHIDIGCLVNIDCTIGHDTTIGKFCELCPGVHISGGCSIGDEVFIGTGAVILPGVKIGKGAIIGAGAVVTKDIPEGKKAVGIPAKYE